MRLLLRCVAAAMLIATATSQAQDVSADVPGADAFKPGSGRAWLAGCDYQSERYVACKDAARPILEAIISNAGDGTPGEALQAYMRELFTKKGCTFDAPPESFGVNGIFLSFDAKAASRIRCDGKSSDLVFKPGVIVLLDTLYFFTGDPPQ